jgi:hypothetical protein
LIKGKIKQTKDSKSIFIYGLKQGREMDVSTNSKKILTIIEAYNKMNKIKLNAQTFDSYSYDSIGFSHSLRESNQNYIINLLEFIQKNIDRKDLNNSYSDSEDYENIKADTDEEDSDEEEDYYDENE